MAFCIDGRQENYDFGIAIRLLKDGLKVARKGWNGKDMCLVLIGEEDYDIDLKVVGFVIGSLLPWIGMRTADNKLIPWLASQTDILAEDWKIVD